MRNRKLSIFALCLALLGSAVLPGAPKAEEESSIQAVFINVGKADAILLLLNQQRFLVDAGHKDSYDALEKALETCGIDHLDGVFITHTDKDHVGGLNKLLKSDIQVDMLYASTLNSEPDVKEHPVYEASQKRDVPLTWLRAGEVIEAGECSLHILGPINKDQQDEDNNSLVIDVQTPHGNFLLTGDMKKEEEASLLAADVIPQATVLKVAHHGEDDSTSSTFLRTVKPQWSIISTDREEEPDTAADVVLARLWDVKSGVAITQNATLGILVTLKDGQAYAEQLDYQ
ncbi:MAG: MBL fold metallo-hydrolase [Clostridiales bacterium]|nr:MBL fold metallo-hydrolase [Clostridiales bacterium]